MGGGGDMVSVKKLSSLRLSNPRLAFGFIVALSTLCCPLQAALAGSADNDADESKGETLSEVVVTARKRSEDVQSVPVSVSAVTGDQLKQQSIKTVANLQNLAPGLFVQQGLDDNQTIIVTMRGRKQDDATMAVDSSVSLNVDGVYIPRTLGMAGSMLDIKYVEVLRGPQGTLYGRNTTGGAIGIFTNDPTHELSGSVDLTGGNYGTWNAVGIANIPIADNLDARFVAQRGGNGGYAHTTSGTPLGDSRSEYYRGKLRWSGSNNWQAVLSGHYEDDRSGGTRAFIPGLDPANFQDNGLPEGSYLTLQTMADLGVSEAEAVALQRAWTAQRSPWYTLDNTHGPASVSKVHRWDVGLNISGDVVEDVQFRSISAVQSLSREVSGGPQFPVFIFKQHPHSTGTYYSQELQLLGKTRSFNWVVGTYGGYETGTDGQNIFFLPAVFGTGAVANDSGIRNTTLAGYAQATWEFIPDWRLTAGARYTSDTRRVDAGAFLVDLLDPSIHDCVVPAPGVEASPPGESQCPRTFKAAFSKPTWLVSLDHQLTPDVLLYVKAATGYRSGGLNANNGAVEEEAFGSFAPESNIEYEAGIKSEFLGRRVRVNADVYWDDYSDLQVQSIVLGSDNNFLTLETNAAKARIRGVELEADFLVGGGLRLHASTAYTGAHYLSYQDLTGDHSHRPFAIPKWTSSLSANYTRATPIGVASIELDYARKSAVNVVPPSTLVDAVTQPGYGLLNARATLHLERWNMDVAVFGQNLTNKEFFEQGFNVAAPGFDFDDVYIGGAPRTFGVELIKKFGKTD
jgi:iron complex outermembrane recepter protein